MTGGRTLRVGVDVGGTHVRVGVVDGLQVVWEARIAAHFARVCRPEDPGGSLAHVLGVLAEAVSGALARFPEVVGVYRNVRRPCYEELLEKAITADVAKKGQGTVADLFKAEDIWTVE